MTVVRGRSARPGSDRLIAPAHSQWSYYTIGAVAVLICRLLAIIPCHVYDDAFITFRFAENFAAGRGFVYNPGAPWEPVLGTTTPVYACILAAAAAAGFNLSVFGVLFSALCDAVSAILIMRCFPGEIRIGGWTAVLGFALMPELNRNSAGGMESSLFVMIVLLAMSCCSRRRLIAASLLGALAAMIRPEGVLMLPILVCLHVRSVRAAMRLIAPASVLGATYIAVLTWYFGSPIPNSVLAKADLYAGVGGWSRILEIVAGSFAPSWPMLALCPLAAFGCYRCLRAEGPARAFSILALLMTAAYIAARPMMFNWYYQAVLTADCLWLGAGAACVLQAAAPVVGLSFDRHRRAVLLATASLVIIGVGLAAYHMGSSRIRANLYGRMNAWARRSANPGTTILACDIGCIGYVSKARILDTGGLVWPEARRRTREPELIKEYRPDYALIIASPRRVRVMQTDPELVRLYVPVERFNAGDDRRLVFPEELLSDDARRKWAANWRHDYILYARRDLPLAMSSEAEAGGVRSGHLPSE